MSVPDSSAGMHAAYITELGAAEAIRYGRLPVPSTGPTDVLVKVEAVVVNPVDTFVRSGGYRTPMPLPFVVGRDLVGTVAAAGAGAVGFTAGDRVPFRGLRRRPRGRQRPQRGPRLVPRGRSGRGGRLPRP